jgi:hypothetical protein
MLQGERDDEAGRVHDVAADVHERIIAPVRLNGEYVRDEAGQATYLRETLEIFEAEGVDSAFVFSFALHQHLHRPDGDARDDLDLASYGIVKVLDERYGEIYRGLPWEPKAAFAALAECYRS